MNTARTFFKTLANLYEDKPDDEVISVGHWRRNAMPVPGIEGAFVDVFAADIRLTVGEIRKYAK